MRKDLKWSDGKISLVDVIFSSFVLFFFLFLFKYKTSNFSDMYSFMGYSWKFFWNMLMCRKMVDYLVMKIFEIFSEPF